MISEVDLFHTGYVVSDIAASMRTLTDAIGYEWASVADVTRSVNTDQGLLPRRSLVSYTSNTPEHHIELMQLIDGSAWERMPRGSDLPHIGYWSGDFDEDVHRLQRAGFRLYMLDSESSTSYHHNAAFGYYVEFVNVRDRPLIQAWIEGSALTIGQTDSAV